MRVLGFWMAIWQRASTPPSCGLRCGPRCRTRCITHCRTLQNTLQTCLMSTHTLEVEKCILSIENVLASSRASIAFWVAYNAKHDTKHMQHMRCCQIIKYIQYIHPPPHTAFPGPPVINTNTIPGTHAKHAMLSNTHDTYDTYDTCAKYDTYAHAHGLCHSPCHSPCHYATCLIT